MLKKLLVLMVATVVVAFGVTAIKVTPQSLVTSPVSSTAPLEHRDPAGFVGTILTSGNPFLAVTPHQFGTTAMDAQRWDNGVRAAVDSKGNIHFAYMYYPLTGGSWTSRVIKYNMWDVAGDSFIYKQSIQVSGAKRTGYCTIGVLSDNRPVVAYHEATIGASDTITGSVVAVEVSAGLGVFSYANLPVDPTLQEIWPNVLVGSDDVIHLIAHQSETDNNYDGEIISYSRSTDKGKNFSSWNRVVNYGAISEGRLAVSPDGKKVAVVFPKGFTYPSGDTVYYNFGHFGYRESTDGGKTWGPVTIFTEDRFPEYPIADENLRFWGVYEGQNLAGIYDDKNNLHVVFTEGLISTPTSGFSWIPRIAMRLTHWSKSTGEYSTDVAGKLTQVKTDNTGASWGEDIDTLHMWGSVAYPDYESRWYYFGTAFPTLVRAGSNLVCLWQGQWDTTEMSAAYYPTMDIYASISDDYGVSWKPLVDWDSVMAGNDSTVQFITNITQTESGTLAAPNFCEDEACVSACPYVGSDNMLQITYIKDLFSGDYIHCDPTQTDNPVMYINYPVKVGKKIEDAVEESPLPLASPIELLGSGPYAGAVRFNVGAPSANTSLKIYNVSGSLVETVVSGSVNAGTISWNSTSVPAGVYFYSFSTPTNTSSGRFVVVH